MRRYGDNYWSLIENNGLFYAAISNPINYYSYKNKKSFLLATKDGSNIDKTYNLINKGKKPYSFYIWLNGTPEKNKFAPVEINSLDKSKTPYLFYAARIVRSKQQHLALDLIKILKDRNIKLNLYMAGEKDDQDYFAFLLDKAKRASVEKQVFYLGSITSIKLQQMASEALASLSFYKFCNLGNVLIEYLTAGGMVISMNDGSLDDIISNEENGFLIDSMNQAADIVEMLLYNKKLCKTIKEKAIETANNKFMTWDERVTKEIELIKSVVKQNLLSS